MLLFALDADTAGAVGQQFETGHAIRKTYQAMVRGWSEAEGVIDHPLRRLRDDPHGRSGAAGEAQPALTRYRTLGRVQLPLAQGRFESTRCALVELMPLTGRRHQLRRHLKHIAHPILGDATHGKGPLNRAVADLLGLQRLWLHATRLELDHPATGQRLRIEAEPGDEWDLWRPFEPPADG